MVIIDRILDKILGDKHDTVEKGRKMLGSGKMVNNVDKFEQAVPDTVPGVIDDLDYEEDKGD